MSVLLSNVTVTVPEPLRDVDDTPEHPSSPDRTPSILDVASASMTSAEAPGILYDTDMERLPDTGLYCTLSLPIDAMPTSDSATMTSITENGENLTLRTFICRMRFSCAHIQTSRAPEARTGSQMYR